MVDPCRASTSSRVTSSPFEAQFGASARVVSLKSVTLPEGWRQRVVRVESPVTGGAVGYCLETHDLAVSKYVAARPDDRAFNRLLLQHGLVNVHTRRARCAQLADATLAHQVEVAIVGDWTTLRRGA